MFYEDGFLETVGISKTVRVTNSVDCVLKNFQEFIDISNSYRNMTIKLKEDFEINFRL